MADDADWPVSALELKAAKNSATSATSSFST
jgi:hypothetical protein